MNVAQINIFVGILLEEDENRNFMRIQRRRLRDELNPFDLTNNAFRQMFRLDKNSVYQLINSLLPHATERHILSGIPFTTKVFATLNFISTGSYQNSVGCNSWISLSQTSISRSIHYICELIVNHLLQQWVKFPITPEEKFFVKNGFYEKYNLRGIVGAIDGTHVDILAPPETDENFPPFVYINRKGKHSINVMLISDSSCKILACSARFPGSTHDSAIWQISGIRVHLSRSYFEGDVSSRLIGDSGYPLEPWLFTPFLQPANQAEEQFNALLTTGRNVIERTNGVLKGRFRCLSRHRALIYSPDRAANIIYTCCVLHNIALHANLILPEEEIEHYREDNVNRHDQHNNDLLHIGRNLRNNYIRENIII
ncbi:hypothetical protein RN001_005536 [Aquatica leii]|uniref:DDE Tnp4 domain-containing protein n=1 Tax=Aquatica leii TaxID=1421715 RepID=A0AAN7Q1F3_9COLE|nr:hypothetical protein RN001_005536 [Aquatica leii]